MKKGKQEAQQKVFNYASELQLGAHQIKKKKKTKKMKTLNKRGNTGIPGVKVGYSRFWSCWPTFHFDFVAKAQRKLQLNSFRTFFFFTLP